MLIKSPTGLVFSEAGTESRDADFSLHVSGLPAGWGAMFDSTSFRWTWHSSE